MNNLIKRLGIGAATLATITFAGSYEADAHSFKYAVGKEVVVKYHTHPSEPKQKVLKGRSGFPGKDAIIFANNDIGRGNGYKTIAYSPSTKQVYFVDLKGNWQEANKIKAEYNPKNEHKGIKIVAQKVFPALPPLPSRLQSVAPQAPAIPTLRVPAKPAPQLPQLPRPAPQTSQKAPINYTGFEYFGAPVKGVPSFGEAITRYALSLGVSNNRTGLTGSVDWKLGDSKFRFGPYFTKFNSSLTKNDDSTQVTGTALELVGPGVYRQRNDVTRTEKEENLSDREFGVILSYPISHAWEIFATLGRTERETLEKKTLTSTVIFKDNLGNVIGNPQVATNALSPDRSKENIATLGIGVDYNLNNYLFLRGQVKIIGENNENVETMLSVGTKF